MVLFFLLFMLNCYHRDSTLCTCFCGFISYCKGVIIIGMFYFTCDFLNFMLVWVMTCVPDCSTVQDLYEMCFLSCLCTGAEQAVGAEISWAYKRLQTSPGWKRSRRSLRRVNKPDKMQRQRQLVHCLQRCVKQCDQTSVFERSAVMPVSHWKLFSLPKMQSQGQSGTMEERAKWKLNRKMMLLEEQQTCGPNRSRRNDREQETQDKQQQWL